MRCTKKKNVNQTKKKKTYLKKNGIQPPNIIVVRKR